MSNLGSCLIKYGYFLICGTILSTGLVQAQVADVSIVRLEKAAQKVEQYCGKLTVPVMPSETGKISDSAIKKAKEDRNQFQSVVQKYTKCLDHIIETYDPASPVVAEAALAHDYAHIKYGDISEKYILAEIAWQDQPKNH